MPEKPVPEGRAPAPAQPAAGEPPAEEAHWGREVVPGTAGGHPCLTYARRPGSLAELLSGTGRWAEREFLVQGERRLSYGAFTGAVARVAAYLRGLGVRPGQRVMLLGFNQIEWVVAFWAAQTLGAVAVLGNAWWSGAETAAALDQAAPVLVLASESRPGGAAPLAPAARVLGLDALRPLVDGGPAAPRPAAPDPVPVAEDDPALIMFSSGTTGTARGVVMSHRSVIANLQNLLVLTGRLPTELPPGHPGTVSLLSVPLFHLAGIQTSCTTMLTGGKLVFLSGRFDPAEVLALIERERVRVWGSVPTMVSRVLDHPGLTRRDTSSLRSVPMGGAAVSPELRQRVAASFPGVKSGAGSLYGLTEAGGVLAAGSGPDLDDRPGCVGRALPVVELRIAGPGPDGVGEIQARTPTATDGYLGDPAPLADPDGWISTGDLGRIEEPGWLYVTGRSKDIIIRGGENVACAHVERALLRHPDVLEAVAVGLPDADLGEEVGAVVVLRPGARAGLAELRRHAGTELARFEHPARWWLRRGPLPVNATGKILRREIRSDWLARGAGDLADLAGRAESAPGDTALQRTDRPGSPADAESSRRP
jgi:long-chain acyl-CoA synthetase